MWQRKPLKTEVTFAGPLTIYIAPPPEPSQAGVWITATMDGFTVKGKNMAYTLPNDKMINVQVAYVDAKGNPAKVDGDVAWSSSNEEIVTVEVDSGDSTMAKVFPGAKTGNAQILATADADLGEGVKELITPMDITIAAGEAVAGTITPVGEAQPVGAHVEHFAGQAGQKKK